MQNPTPFKGEYNGQSLVDIAVSYAQVGLAVIPIHYVKDGRCSCQFGDECPSPGKHPKGMGWNKKATTEIDVVEARFLRNPSVNIGCKTGAISGIFVLDVDPKNGGFESLKALIDEHEPLPPTLVARTPSSGVHYYFSLPDGIGDLKDRIGSIADGLDIRADGGQVVMPPSKTDIGSYSWQSTREIADSPQWLIDKIKELQPKRKTVSDKPSIARPPEELKNYVDSVFEAELEKIIEAPWGAHNQAINDAAFNIGTMVGNPSFGINREYAFDQLWEATQSVGDPDRRAEGTINSGLDAGIERPRDTPVALEDSVEQTLDEEAKALRYQSDLVKEIRQQRIRNDARDHLRQEKALEIWSPDEIGFEPIMEVTESAKYEERIPGMAGRNFRVVVSALRSVGKTKLLQNLVRSLVDSKPFMGREVTLNGGNIAWLNAELYDDLFKAYISPLNIQNHERFLYKNVVGKPIPLNNPVVYQWLVKIINDGNVEILILDSWRKFVEYAGLDANNDAQKITDVFDRLIEETCLESIFILAHQVKDKKGVGAVTTVKTRGDSSLEEWADAIWYLEGPEDQQTKRIEIAKRVKDPLSGPFHFDPITNIVELGEAQDTEVPIRVTNQNVVADDRFESMRDIAAKHPGIKQSELGKKMSEAGIPGGKNPNTLKGLCTDAVKNGYLSVKQGEGRSLLYWAKQVANGPEDVDETDM